MKILSTLIALFLFTLTTANAADQVSAGDITVSKAWGRATIGANRPGGAFLTITNNGAAGDQLVAAETPAAGKSELHTHTMTDGVMKMEQVMSIDIPAGGMTMLKPGGFHVMMFKLKKALNEGDMFPLTLTFRDAGPATVMVHVGKVGAMKTMDHKMHMDDEGHKKMHEEHMKDDEHKKMHEEHMKGATEAQ
jgi:periplasmic copper chaperone A